MLCLRARIVFLIDLVFGPPYAHVSQHDRFNWCILTNP